MNISFKGFEQTGIGVDHCSQKRVFSTPDGREITVLPYTHLTLNTKLNNKIDTDLKDFAEVLKEYPPIHEKDSVYFTYDNYYDPLEKTRNTEFWLNGKAVALKDKNLPVFSKIAQLFTKLSKSGIHNINFDKKYINSSKCKDNFPYFRNYEYIANYDEIISSFHHPQNIRQNAQKMVEEFYKIMTKHIG